VLKLSELLLAVTKEILMYCLQVCDAVYHSVFQNKVFVCIIRVASTV